MIAYIDFSLVDEFDVQTRISSLISDEHDVVLLSDDYCEDIQSRYGESQSVSKEEEANNVFGCDIVFTDGTDLAHYASNMLEYDVVLVSDINPMFKRPPGIIVAEDNWQKKFDN